MAIVKLGNFSFDDKELKELPEEGKSEVVGAVGSFAANAIGDAEGETIPVVVTWRVLRGISIETEADIDARLSSIEADISRLDEEKIKKLDDKDKLK